MKPHMQQCSEWKQKRFVNPVIQNGDYFSPNPIKLVLDPVAKGLSSSLSLTIQMCIN